MLDTDDDSVIFAHMVSDRIILEEPRFVLTLKRLSHQLIEDHGDFSKSCLVGIQPRGVDLANRLYHILTKELKVKTLPYGKLDITFHRDDFRTRHKPLAAHENDMPFLVEDRRVILVDDVLYTGRSIQAALSALTHYGRPREVSLVTLIDRRFNRHLPIQANYVGLRVDALDEAYVKVEWNPDGSPHQVLLFAQKSEKED